MLSSMTISTLTMMLLINMMLNSLPFGVSDFENDGIYFFASMFHCAGNAAIGYRVFEKVVHGFYLLFSAKVRQ